VARRARGERFRKGHRYHTVVCDLERSTVEFVAEGRKTGSLAACYAHPITDDEQEQLSGLSVAVAKSIDLCIIHT
jgi:hypothetical protein